MNQLLTMSMTTSMLFTQTKHPMAMGLILLIQTILMCLISGTMFKSFWFSYILFMIMIVGMLVLFMYMKSIASNEMFLSPNQMIIIVTMMTPLIYTMMTDPTSNKEMNNHDKITENEVTTTTTPMSDEQLVRLFSSADVARRLSSQRKRANVSLLSKPASKCFP